MSALIFTETIDIGIEFANLGERAEPDGGQSHAGLKFHLASTVSKGDSPISLSESCVGSRLLVELLEAS